ncbi:MAG: tetratricopeptide repeat protein, partial [Chloroflexi bacterium]|nr:tetratricopeptide repeat protein [Chloroflexota bacterium]
LPALITLAELAIQQHEPDKAREYLNSVWELAERGPYPLFHADALNLLARLDRAGGDLDAARKSATRAYELSWCSGPPYAYHWGLESARQHLIELGAPVPDLPLFDPAQHPPMPEIII